MKSSPPRQAPRRAFTLIEVLVVIAIIAVLAGLLLQTSGFVQEKAGTSRAKTEIAALETALESYKIDNGTYPEGDGSDESTKILIDVLSGRNPSDEPPGDEDTPKKIYFEIPAKMLPRSGNNASYEDNLRDADNLVDPFGNPYRYEFPGKADRSGTDFFDLWSQGRKNTGDEAKWIKNW